jgi:putative exporter of polyketide antibiotics
MFYLGYIVCLLLPVLWEELCRFLVQYLGLGLFFLFADMLLNLKLYTHIVRSAFNSVQVEYIIIMEKL